MTSEPFPDGFDDAAAMIASAGSIAVLTGAGCSAESGVPTFRDALEGLWSKYDPMDLATPEAFERDPELVSRWYDQRRQTTRACEPNAGHLALAALERWAKQHDRTMNLLTQNVDRLHQRAGSGDVVELHGSLHVWRCTKSGRAQDNLPDAFAKYPSESSEGGLLRPGVVWFGELLPADALERAESAAVGCDVFLTIGTSALVYPAAGLVQIARDRGARTIEINRDSTAASAIVDVSLRGLFGVLMPALVAAVISRESRGPAANPAADSG